MGCVIAGNRNERIIPSILDANSKGFPNNQKAGQYMTKGRRQPSIEVSEAFVAGSTCNVDTQYPKTESEIGRSLNKFSAGDAAQIEQKAKLSGFAAGGKETEDHNCGQQDTTPKIILSGADNSVNKQEFRVSSSYFERPMVNSSLRSTAHFGSTQTEINENNSNFHRHNYKTSSLVEACAESHVFTLSKHESVRSIPNCEERPSLEEDIQFVKKSSIDRRTPSLGVIDAVEEVNASREFNLKASEGDDNIISNIPSINSIERSPRGPASPIPQDKNQEEKPREREEKHWQIKIIRSSTHQIPEEIKKAREIKKIGPKSQSFPVKGKAAKGAKQSQENKENESKLAGNSIVKPSKAIPNLVENNGNKVIQAQTQEERLVKRQSSKKSLHHKENTLTQSANKKQKVKEQAKAKFTRNLVELVTTHRERAGQDSDDDDESEDFFDHRPKTFNALPIQDDQNESLSLMNCVPDEIDHNRPNLIDLKNLDLFGDGEGFSPISPDRPDFGDTTPLTSVISTFRRRDIESPSTVMEDRTITNLEDNISKLDLDKYSFTAEVRAVEIDEKNNYNIYNNVKPSQPHEPVQRSAFVIKPRRVFKSKTEIYNKIKSAELAQLIDRGSLADEVLSASALNYKRKGKNYPDSSKL